MRLLTGQDAVVAEWAGRKLGTAFVPPFVALGVIDGEGRLRGAVIYNDYTGPNIELTIVGEPAAWTRGVIRAGFAYPFKQLKCDRVTVRTRRRNKRVRRLAPRLGFKFEGVARRFYGDDDALVFGMLRDECRWI